MRQAWLDLDGIILNLDNHTAGYAMIELDLGFPDIRDVVNNAPNQHGIDDQTAFFGGRPVTAKIAAWPGGTVALDDIVELFMPYLRPAARPILHYTTESSTPLERVITLRASNFASPMPSPGRRDMELAWVAPDPLIRDAIIQMAAAYVGSSTPGGRSYNLFFDRSYGLGGGAPSTAHARSKGDVAIAPLFRFYGPVVGPRIQVISSATRSQSHSGQIAFDLDFRVDTGHWVDIDCQAHTALLDSDQGQSVISELQFSVTQWPLLYPEPYDNAISAYGSDASGVSQVQTIWQDAFIQ
jgi:hypothetical protein